MGKGMTERDAQAATFLVGRIREETYGANTWDQPGIWAELKPLVGQNLELTLERVFRHAADPEAKTPGAIRRAFLPPPASEKPHIKRGNPHRDEECPKHPGQWPDNCAACKAERAVKAERDAEPPSPNLPPIADVNPRLADRLAALRGPEVG